MPAKHALEVNAGMAMQRDRHIRHHSTVLFEASAHHTRLNELRAYSTRKREACFGSISRHVVLLPRTL